MYCSVCLCAQICAEMDLGSFALRNGKRWPTMEPGCAAWRGLSTANAHRNCALGLYWNTQPHGERRGAFRNTLPIKKKKKKAQKQELKILT